MNTEILKRIPAKAGIESHLEVRCGGCGTERLVYGDVPAADWRCCTCRHIKPTQGGTSWENDNVSSNQLASKSSTAK